MAQQRRRHAEKARESLRGRSASARRAMLLLLVTMGAGVPPGRGEAIAADPPHRGATGLAAAGESGRRPLAFEPNGGQLDARVEFVARGVGFTVFLTPAEAVLALGRGAGSERAVLRLKPVGADRSIRPVAQDPLPGVAHHSDLRGGTPIELPTYAGVRYAEVYPGVDLVYYGRPRELEYDFVVAPGADPGRIAMAIEGAERLELAAAGDLLVHTGAGLLRQPRPVAYQEVGGERRRVSADYVVDGDGGVRFRLGAYDRSRRLVIDPVLAWSTYLGGGDEERDPLWGPVTGIALDAAGNVYVTGSTTSVDFPTTPGADRTLGGDQDVFVTKLSPAGAVLYSTYLGGPCEDMAYDIAVDGAGAAYVTGRAHGTTCSYGLSPGALVAKLGPTGSAVYALVFGGSVADTSAGTAIAVDTQGRAHVAGTTASTDFPTTPGALRRAACPDLVYPGYSDGFVARISAAGTLVFSTYLCGNDLDTPNDLALDAAGNMIVAGTTRSGDFPTVAALQATSHTYPAGSTGFVSKLRADGAQLLYSTYLGGSINDALNGLALDGQGNVYVTGETQSADFPTTAGVLQPEAGNPFCLEVLCTDAFVAKIAASGAALVYSTYLHGESDDGGAKIAVDSTGHAYVAGTTSSLYFPIRDAFQPTHRVRGPSDAFVAKLAPDGRRLAHSSYLGGSGGASPLTGADDGSAIAIDAAGNAYVVGSTRSLDFPTTPGAFQRTIGGGVCDGYGTPCDDAFVAKIGAGGAGEPAPTSVVVTPADVAPGGTVTASWAGVPIPSPQDSLVLYALGSTSDASLAWWTTGGAGAGTLPLPLPAGLPFGTYEIRLLSPDPNASGLLRAVARSQPIRVGTDGACGLGPDLVAVLPLLRALRRRLRRRS